MPTMCSECTFLKTLLHLYLMCRSINLNQCGVMVLVHPMEWYVEDMMSWTPMQWIQWQVNIRGYWFVSNGEILSAHIWRLPIIHEGKRFTIPQSLGILPPYMLHSYSVLRHRKVQFESGVADYLFKDEVMFI